MSPKFVYSMNQTNILTNYRLSQQYVILINHNSNQLGPKMHRTIEFTN